eukprot:scaffold1921_cov384-Pinguiococcus_pyrenoidosus.AAC.1
MVDPPCTNNPPAPIVCPPRSMFSPPLYILIFPAPSSLNVSRLFDCAYIRSKAVSAARSVFKCRTFPV